MRIYFLMFIVLGFGWSLAAQTVIDDFENYTLGDFLSNDNDPDTDAKDSKGGPWSTSNGGNGSSLVAIQEEGVGGNRYLAAGYTGGIRGGYRELGEASLLDGTNGIYYWEIRSLITDQNFSWGLADDAVTTGDDADFRVQIHMNGNALRVWDDDAFTNDLTGNLGTDWIGIWVVVDNTADTFDAYYSTSTLGAGNLGSATALGSGGFGFRGGSASNNLNTFAAINHSGISQNLSGQIDNLTLVPEASSLMLVTLAVGAAVLPGLRRRIKG
ncbi:hypothetical protein P0Y35_18395 [Kiritimatiellaeota bacterium B1221]|nr:hypothetical protein [Kiritimatiellaeota bacterium B1221]